MIVVVMGVSGCGKTTIGQLLADRMGWPFFDGDDYHPPANVEKMSRSIPLTDEDRSGWLSALADLIRVQLVQSGSAVLACSALKQKYRDRLRIDPRVHFAYLKGSYDFILARMQKRPGHYMKPNMLASQFAALEEPQEALTLDITQPPEEIVEQIVKSLIER